MYFDSHAHYDDEQFEQDRENLLLSLDKIDHVSYIINCGADLDSSKKSIELANKYDFVYSAIGFHPENINNMSDKDIDSLRDLTKNKKVKAIGEIGLDYHYENFSQEQKDRQKYWFEKQILLANDLDLPMIIHSRDASLDTYEIIKSISKTKGVVHCFSGSLELAQNYINLGFLIGIGGIITFKNAKNLLDVVNNIPIEKILIETDCPYLSPEPNRGQRNDSSNLKYIVEKISQIKNISHEKIAKITCENAKKLFDIEL